MMCTRKPRVFVQIFSQLLQYTSALGGTLILLPISWGAFGQAGVPLLTSSGKGVFSEVPEGDLGTRGGRLVHVAVQTVLCTTPGAPVLASAAVPSLLPELI